MQVFWSKKIVHQHAVGRDNGRGATRCDLKTRGGQGERSKVQAYLLIISISH